MAKKHKTTETEIEAMLDEPAAVTGDTPIRQQWPESTETRTLQVTLPDTEVIERAQLLCKELREADDLANQKKASADHYKARIEAKEKEIEDSKAVVTSCKEDRPIVCRWIFETNGFTNEGAAIYHSEMKTLVRDDTGEYVAAMPITQSDRQMVLPLDESEATRANMEAIETAGYVLEETPARAEDIDAAFVLYRTDADADYLPVARDNLHEASILALEMIAHEKQLAAAA